MPKPKKDDDKKDTMSDDKNNGKRKREESDKESDESDESEYTPPSDEDDEDEDYKDEHEEHEYTEKDLMEDDEETEDEAEKIIDPIIKEKFCEVRKEIESQDIKINDILLAPIKVKEKAILFELHEVLKSADPRQEEYILLKHRIAKLYRQYLNDAAELAKLTKEQQEKLNKDESMVAIKMKKNITNQTILALPTDEENKIIILEKLKECADNSGEEKAKIYQWLKLAMDLPYNRVKTLPIEADKVPELLLHVRKVLDDELFGMNKIKDQLLLFLNSKIRYSGIKGCNLGLIGAPGVGKTAIARTLATALDYPFYQLSFGGVKDSSFLVGHDFTYVGSQPGHIAKALAHLGYKNGILFLDEFEKVSDCKEIITTLLHIIDFTQNNSFHDHYFGDLKIDLSSIWYMFSSNTFPDDSALRDRVFFIKVDGYNFIEKVKILRDYLLPKALVNIGLNKTDITLGEYEAKYFVEKVSLDSEEGVRSIEREIKNIINKIYFAVCNGNTEIGKKCSFINFDCVKNIKFPVSISKEMIDKLVENEKELRLDMYV